MSRSTPGLPVHHQLPKSSQTHAHRVGDAIQPSHPLSSPSPPAPNPSQHQGLFRWVSSSNEVVFVVLEFYSYISRYMPSSSLVSDSFCNPMGCSLPGSSSHGIFQARILEWLPFLPAGDLPNPGIEPTMPVSAALAGGFFTIVPSVKPFVKVWVVVILSELSGIDRPFLLKCRCFRSGIGNVLTVFW